MNEIFETCTASFKMADRKGTEQIFHTGTRHNVTPGEFKILQQIHRAENVQVAELTGIAQEIDGFEDGKAVMRPRTNAEELDRLRGWYGAGPFEAVFGKAEVIDLPLTFAEARIPTSVPNNVRPITRKKKSGSAVENADTSQGASDESDSAASG